MSNKQRIILTGGGGLIGGALLHKLNNYDVVSLARNESETESVYSNINLCSVDLATNWSTELLPKNADIVIHLAQSPYFREFPSRAMDIFNVNLATTQKLLDYAVKNKAKQFIMASSGGVYGYGEEAFKEDVPLNMKDGLGYYLSTKHCMEVLASNYTDSLNIIILRFFFVYGPNQKRSMLIPRLVDNVRTGTAVTLQGEEGIFLNPTHVTDAIEAINAALTSNKSGIFNVGGPDVLSLREICSMISKRVGRDPIFEIDSKSEPKNLIGDISKMKQLLWEPSVSFDKGIESVL